MVGLDVRLAVSMSYRRAKKSGDVLGRFYDLFLASDPEVSAHFEGVDFDRQKSLLHSSLEVAIFVSADDLYATAGLQRLRALHGDDQLGIPTRLYSLWRDSLIRAVSEMDPGYDDLVEKHWHLVLQPAIDYLTSGPGLDGPLA